MNDDGLHPGHHSIRLPGADYTRAGLYFLTICSFERSCIFAETCEAQARLKPVGFLIQACWFEILKHFRMVHPQEFIVMPNHFHGIVQIGCQQGRGDAAPLQRSPLSTIVRSFKSAVTKRAHQELRFDGEVWQRRYFERIIRPGQELEIARAYILENPRKWEWDRENPHRRS